MQKRTIYISREEYGDVQTFLDKGKPVNDVGRDEILKIFQVDFGEGVEADIRIINSDRPYVGGSLYNGDCETAVLEPREELLGGYTFDHEGRIYVVEIQVKQEIKVKA